jgi:spermidine synthase
LGTVLVAGGVLLALVPAAASVVLANTISLGPRVGPLVAAMLLFAPTLGALGMPGPIAVRLRSTDISVSGHQVGSTYALSTAGSLAGTLVTSFWLVPEFETAHILLGAAALLIAVGALVLGRRRQPLTAVTILLPLFALGALSKPQLPPHLQVLAEARSLYGRVQVIDDTARGVRFLRSDHSVLGAQWIADGSAAFAFLHGLEVLPFLRPKAKDVLVIGLGSGSVPAAMAKRGLKVDVVEIDPTVVHFAQQYLGLPPVRSIVVGDARAVINRSAEQYDLIVHDTFTGGSTPEHLLSLEVLHRLHAMLNPGGVLALTLVGFTDGPNRAASLAVLQTMRAAFRTVRVFRDSPTTEEPQHLANLLFFASDGSLTWEIPADAQFPDAYCGSILPALAGWEVLKDAPSGEVITDARNGLARLQVPVAEEHFQAMAELLPAEVWLQ